MGESRRRVERDAAAAGPLAGFTVAVASDRRRHELAHLLDQHGARTVGVQVVRVVPQPDVDALAAAIEDSVAEPVDEVIVSSAFGLRAWMAVARHYGREAATLAQLSQARLLARDARAADGLRELGMTQIWSTALATTEALFRYLMAQPLPGKRILAQVESDSDREMCRALRVAGAQVVEIATTQAAAPRNVSQVRHLADVVVRRQVDAVALTSGAATRNLLKQAAVDGVRDEVLNALVEEVPAVCLGELSAAALRELGLTPLIAGGPFMREIAVRLSTYLPMRALVVTIGGRRIEIRGQAIVVAGRLLPIQPGPMAVLRALARRPGRVLSAAEIRAVVPSGTAVDDHAIEMAVSRLRKALHDTGLSDVDLVQTVMRRGYRLAG